MGNFSFISQHMLWSSQGHSSLHFIDHFWKTSDNRTVWPLQLSMTADAAIRIVLHSAEVVHFHHNIWYIRARIIRHNLSLTFPSISTSPHELGLPAKATCHPGNCTGLGPDSSSLFHVIFLTRRQPRHNPYDACSEGTHTKVYKIPVKPYPDSGIVVVR